MFKKISTCLRKVPHQTFIGHILYTVLEAGMKISTWGWRAIDWGAKSTILGKLYAKI